MRFLVKFEYIPAPNFQFLELTVLSPKQTNKELERLHVADPSSYGRLMHYDNARRRIGPEIIYYEYITGSSLLPYMDTIHIIILNEATHVYKKA